MMGWKSEKIFHSENQINNLKQKCYTKMLYLSKL